MVESEHIKEYEGQMRYDEKVEHPREKEPSSNVNTVWWKQPQTIVFIVIVLLTLLIRTKYMYQPSLWVDETHYMVYGPKLLSNPLGIFARPLSNNIQFPAIITAIASIFLPGFEAGRMMNLIFVLAGVIVTYLIGKELNAPWAGLFGALLMVFNPLHWFIGSRALVDVPVATMIAVFMYTLIRFNKYKSKASLWWLIASLVATSLTKATGLIVFVILAAYYVYYLFVAPRFDSSLKKIKWRDVIKSKWTYAGLLAVVVIFYNMGFGFIVGSVSALGFRFDYIQALNFMVGANNVPGLLLLVLLVIIGHTIFAVAYKKHEQMILPIAFVLFLGIFSFLPGQNNPRYLLPLLTPLYIMIGLILMEFVMLLSMGIQAGGVKFGKKATGVTSIVVLVVVAALVVPVYYTSGNSIIIDKYYTYTGYNEAGQWLKDNAEPDAIIYTMSTSWAFLYTGRDSFAYGGSLSNAAEFTSPAILEQRLSGTDRPFYLVYDVWESWAQPRWLTDQQQILLDMGFQPVHVVTQKHASTEDKVRILQELTLFGGVPDTGAAEVPAVIVLKRGVTSE